MHYIVPRGKDACLRLATMQCVVHRGRVHPSWLGMRFFWNLTKCVISEEKMKPRLDLNMITH